MNTPRGVFAMRYFFDSAIGQQDAGEVMSAEALRFKIKALIEREAPGGQAGTSSNIENYLGFPVGLTGADLARRAVAQARKFGVEILKMNVRERNRLRYFLSSNLQH